LWWLASDGAGDVVAKIQALTTLSTGDVTIYSVDHGVTWSASAPIVSTVSQGGLTYGNYKGSNLFLLRVKPAAGSLNCSLYTSTDGAAWTFQENTIMSEYSGPAEANNTTNKVRYHPLTQRYYTANANLIYSTDTINWKTTFNRFGTVNTQSMFCDDQNAIIGGIGVVYYAPMVYSYNTGTQFKLPAMDICASFGGLIPNMIPYIKALP
jgi:hypothetical protein